MKIKSKKVVQTNEDVYDITVPGYENFLIEQGIYVHNCVDHPKEVLSGWDTYNSGETVEGSKDGSDAVAQVTYSAFVNPIQTNILDIASEMTKNREKSFTQNIKPLHYNTGKRMMSQQEAMKKAMAMFNR